MTSIQQQMKEAIEANLFDYYGVTMGAGQAAEKCAEVAREFAKDFLAWAIIFISANPEMENKNTNDLMDIYTIKLEKKHGTK